jgi:ketosteroid isomerase-like protein
VRRFAFCIMTTLCAVVSLGFGLPAQAQGKDEQEIRALQDRFAAAFRAKDVGAIMELYAPGNELFVFDLGMPREHVGWEDYKKDWQDFLATLRGPVHFEITDLSIVTDGKIAYSHSIQHVRGMAKSGSALDYDVRVTDDYRKVGEKWLIAQEHVSVPIDLATGKPVMMSKP